MRKLEIEKLKKVIEKDINFLRAQAFDAEVDNEEYQYHKFNFTINENVDDIVYVNISWKGYGTDLDGISHGDALYVLESGSWTQKDSSSGAGESAHSLYESYTGSFGDIVSSGNVSVGVYCTLKSSGDSMIYTSYSQLFSYYVEVNVTYAP